MLVVGVPLDLVELLSSPCDPGRAFVAVTLDRVTWTPAPIFRLVQQVGEVSQPDIEATFSTLALFSLV